MGIDDELRTTLETIEALYYLTRTLSGESARHLAKLRAAYAGARGRARHELLGLMKRDVAAIRAHYGAVALNASYRKIVADARKVQTGLVYISKLTIVGDLFSKYEEAVPRWPQIKHHAFVVFDPQVGQLNSLYELDGQLFHDAQFLLHKARAAASGASKQRYLPYAKHRVLHTQLRQTVLALFAFMEAYLNGLAFDCFQIEYQKLDTAERDFLAEWDSAKDRRRFVQFDQKVFRYPAIVAKHRGLTVDLSGFQPARRIVQSGKEIRDAITHPSAQFDPVTREQKKLLLVVGLDLSHVEAIYKDVCDYVRFIETGIGHDVAQSAPWLFDGHGFKVAKDESV